MTNLYSPGAIRSIILTSGKQLANKCRMYGMKKNHYSYCKGYNSRLDEIQAAAFNIKLKYLDQWSEKLRKIARYYLINIKNPKIILPPIQNINEYAFHLFVIRSEGRKSLIKYLNKEGIGHHSYLIRLQEAYKFLGYKKGDLPVTEKFTHQILSLPIFSELTTRQLKYLVNEINNFSILKK